MPSRHSMTGAQALESTAAVRPIAETIGQFVALTKPRVMSLAVFTAFVGLWIAPRHLDPAATFVALVCIALGAGAAGALNMWYDADIDALMTRTSSRPLPRGQRTRGEALVLGLTLAALAIGGCAMAVNIVAAVLLAITIAYYAIVYTVWLKRRIPQSIVIGGAAGALPPVIGWAATGSALSLEPWLLFLIIFLWTPAHFWALALERAGDYARAGVPALPVVAGRDETKRQILRYSALLVWSSALPWTFGYAGRGYALAAAVLGTAFVVLALRVRRRKTGGGTAARLFAFSIFYLFLLFGALLVDSEVHGERAAVSVFETSVALTP